LKRVKIAKRDPVRGVTADELNSAFTTALKHRLPALILL
jgi:hypothetical protein